MTVKVPEGSGKKPFTCPECSSGDGLWLAFNRYCCRKCKNVRLRPEVRKLVEKILAEAREKLK